MRLLRFMERDNQAYLILWALESPSSNISNALKSTLMNFSMLYHICEMGIPSEIVFKNKR